MRPIDIYFFEKEEPLKGCLLFLRHHILQQDKDITEVWQYGMPFYCYKSKRFCYLWVHKKCLLPYLGIVEGKRVNYPDLIIEKRAKMKILLIDPTTDLSMEKIDGIIHQTLSLYK